MQGSKNWILPKEINETGSAETLIGWKSGKTIYVPLWDRMEGLCGYGLFFQVFAELWYPANKICIPLVLVTCF